MMELVRQMMQDDVKGADLVLGSESTEEVEQPHTTGDTPTHAPPTPAPQPLLCQPHKLSPNVSLREFKVWYGVWSDHEELLQLRIQPLHMQLAYFQSCLTPKMRATLVHAISMDEDDHTNTMQQILTHIKTHLQRQRNIVLQRVRFEEC